MNTIAQSIFHIDVPAGSLAYPPESQGNGIVLHAQHEIVMDFREVWVDTGLILRDLPSDATLHVHTHPTSHERVTIPAGTPLATLNVSRLTRICLTQS